METITTACWRVLVVDDQQAHRRVVAFNLEKAGLLAETAESAAEALKLTGRKHFDLIISDYFMPGATGADFVRELRQTDGYAETPVILLTARAPELDLARLATSLSIRVVSKSCSVGQLVAMVTSLLPERRNQS